MLVQNMVQSIDALSKKHLNQPVIKKSNLQLKQLTKDTVSFTATQEEYKEGIEQIRNALYQSITFPGFEQTFNNAAIQLIKAYDKLDESLQKEVKSLFNFIIEYAAFDPARTIAINFFMKKDKHKEPDFAKLVELADKANQFAKPEGKEYEAAREALLKQEFKILYQELTEPEKYMDRALKMGVVDFMTDDKNEIEDMMHQKALAGLQSMVTMFEYLNIEMEPDKKQVIVDKMFEIIDGENKTEISEDVKYNALNMLIQLYPTLGADQKERIELKAKEITETPKETPLKQLISSFILQSLDRSHPLNLQYEKEMLEILKSDESKPEQKRSALIGLTRIDSEHTMGIANELLDNKDTKQTLKVAAIWVAGMYKDETAFDKLVNILEPDSLPKTLSPANLELKEMVMSSLSEYKNDKALEILNKVKDSECELNEIATALIEKIEGKYSNDSGYALKQANLSEADQKVYTELRAKYVPEFEKNLSVEEQNWTDKALLPFMTVLAEQVSKNRSLYVIDDSPTGINKRDRAIRNFSGFFAETSGGQTTPKGDVVLPRYNLKTPANGNFVFGHEFGHVLFRHLQEFDQNDSKKGIKLYESATRTGKCLDHYAAANPSEYLAQGNEAYLSIIKPHSDIIYNNDFDNISFHTKATLKRKDPDLFRFIDAIYAKYSQLKPEESKPVSLFA